MLGVVIVGADSLWLTIHIPIDFKPWKFVVQQPDRYVNDAQSFIVFRWPCTKIYYKGQCCKFFRCVSVQVSYFHLVNYRLVNSKRRQPLWTKVLSKSTNCHSSNRRMRQRQHIMCFKGSLTRSLTQWGQGNVKAGALFSSQHHQSSLQTISESSGCHPCDASWFFPRMVAPDTHTKSFDVKRFSLFRKIGARASRHSTLV